MNQMNKDFIFASSFLSNSMIGAGIFSLPFVFYTVGLGRGVLYLMFFVAVYLALHLMYAHIIQIGGKDHGLAYFAEKYLGQRFGKGVAYLVICELLLVLTVYLILAPSFLGILFGTFGNSGVILFWLMSSLFVFLNLKWLGWVASLSVMSIGAIVALVFQHSATLPLGGPFFKEVNLLVLMLPFGPLLFALNGRPGISKLVSVWRGAQEQGRAFLLRNAVIVGTMVPSFVYLLFIVSVLKLTPVPSEDAISGLSLAMPAWITICLSALGLVAIWNSYFMIGADIKEILYKDFHFSKVTSAFFVLFVPPALYFLGVSQFIKAISFIGGMLLSLEGIFIVMMWRRAFPKSRLRHVSLVLYLVFLCAIIYQVAQFFI